MLSMSLSFRHMVTVLFSVLATLLDMGFDKVQCLDLDLFIIDLDYVVLLIRNKVTYHCQPFFGV